MSRKRRSGARGKSGRILDRTPQEPVILKATYQRRGDMVGAALAKRQEASSAVGRLLLSRRISECHFSAAQKLILAWRTWTAMANIPPRFGKVANYGAVVIHGPRPDVEPSAWLAAKNRYMGAIEAVGPGLRWATVECLVIDDIAPPRIFEQGRVSKTVYDAMISGLDALVDYFGIPRERRDKAA